MNINSLSGQNPINSPDPNTIDNTQAQSTNLSSETKSTVAKSDSVNNINNVDQNIGSLESKTQNNDMSANMLKNNLLAKVPNNQTQPASTLSTKLSQIKEFSQDKNYPLTLSLPKDSNNQPIDSNKLTVSDYENTFIKETLREVGINNVTDKEVKLFQQEYKNATGKDFSLKNSLTELRSNTIDSKLTARVSQYDLAVAKTVGLETIIAQRQTRSQVADQAYENGTKYVDDLMKGYIAARINAPANLINGATEPIRGLAAMNGIDLSNLVVPRLELAKESEYWNKGSRIGDEELGTTLGLATVIGGNVDKQLLSNPVGKTIVGVESAYNIGTGLAGVDPTEQTNGQYREMGYLEQGLRIVGGGLGAYSLSKNINADNLAKNQPNTSTVAQEVEAVTPEGFKVKVNTDLDSGIKQAEDLNLLARSPEEVARAKKLNETLTVSKKEEVVHGGSIDRAGFRQKIHNAEFFVHNNKHIKAKTEEQAKRFSQTGGKEAQYLPNVNNKVLEKETIWNALNTGLFMRKPGSDTYYFYHRYNETIGYNLGKPTKWVRAELSGGIKPSYHGHPTSIEEVRKHFPEVKE